ncbi:hypothetical protein HPO96_30795 [Kribbella sandramycini]|uniref:Uncharacterized protein n=1 Tax=Kribbella sandramycini TaxID=60450 RepID=A0A7Y4P410_9ACTN|nr:hypothetical protein [Kribbella sandramycini]MBB6566923.1 hypothetical protein [Kribbella sandramycini]NOL44645.1 hypothetical protein [Kribbella sandramycini]
MLPAVALVCSLAACGDNDAKSSNLPTLTAEPSTTSPPPTQSASPKPTALPTTSTQKYGGLTVILNHPNPPANSDDVLAAYDNFERAANKSTATNVEDPTLPKYAVGAALTTIRAQLADQKAKKVVTGGQVNLTTKVQIIDRIGALTTCFDQSKSVLVRANGTAYVGPGTKAFPRIKVVVVLGVFDGQWKVAEYNIKREKC